jgi:hypothetical protein
MAASWSNMAGCLFLSTRTELPKEIRGGISLVMMNRFYTISYFIVAFV